MWWKNIRNWRWAVSEDTTISFRHKNVSWSLSERNRFDLTQNRNLGVILSLVLKVLAQSGLVLCFAKQICVLLNHRWVTWVTSAITLKLNQTTPKIWDFVGIVGKCVFLVLTGNAARCPAPTLCYSPPNRASRPLRCLKKLTAEDDEKTPETWCILAASAPAWSNWPVTMCQSAKAELPGGSLSRLGCSFSTTLSHLKKNYYEVEQSRFHSDTAITGNSIHYRYFSREVYCKYFTAKYGQQLLLFLSEVKFSWDWLSLSEIRSKLVNIYI